MEKYIQLGSNSSDRTVEVSSWSDTILLHSGILYNQQFVQAIYYMNGTELVCVYEDPTAPQLISSTYTLSYVKLPNCEDFIRFSSEKDPIPISGKTSGMLNRILCSRRTCKYKSSDGAFLSETYVGVRPTNATDSAEICDLYVDDVKSTDYYAYSTATTVGNETGTYIKYTIPTNTEGHAILRNIYFKSEEWNIKNEIQEIQTCDEYALFGLPSDYYTNNVYTLYEPYYESININVGDVWTRVGDHSYKVKLNNSAASSADESSGATESVEIDGSTSCNTFMIRPLKECKLEITSPYGWSWMYGDHDCYSASELTTACASYFTDGGQTLFNGDSQDTVSNSTSKLTALGTYTLLSDTTTTLELQPGVPVIIGVCDEASFEFKAS